MKAFRLVVLGYALLALLIAPAWLAADEPVVPGAPRAVEQTTEAAGPVLDEAAEPGTAGSQAPPPEEDSERPATANLADESAEKRDDGQVAAEQRKATQAEPKQRASSEREDEPAAKAAQSGSVTITDFEFTPATITVNIGDTVTWTNEGPTVHTATAEDGSFDTGNLDAGESASATFNQAGTIPYICTPHPFMKGSVVVRAATSGSPGGGTGSDTGATGSDDSETAGTDPAAATGGSDLPVTGFEALAVGLLGLATLATGLLIRRRARPR